MEQKQQIKKSADDSGLSLWKDAWRRLLKNKMAVFSMIVLGIMVAMCVLAPYITSHDYDAIDYTAIQQEPSGEHILGTDDIGRDMYTRILYGGRVSLKIAIMCTLISLSIGITFGAIAAYAGGRVDNIMMRFVDIMYSLPYMFLVIILMTVFGKNETILFMAIGAVSWLTMARIVRGQILSLKAKEFVEAARSYGASHATIIFKHLIPNAFGTVIVYTTITIPRVILVESFLSFLGLGIQEPNPSWGSLCSHGAKMMEVAPWMIIFPGLALSITLFCMNFLGDGLRDALDPKMK